jgi:hypothetical protein
MPQIVCRYCQNVIQVEHRKPPPDMRPFGAPGVMPSRTLYIDPDAAKSVGAGVGLLILVTVGLPILLPILIFVGPWAVRSCKGALRPFPTACDTNEEVEVSGNWEGQGPIFTNVGHNCKVHIKNSKLKGTTLLKGDAANLELTLDNVTIETTDTTVNVGSNLKVKMHGSTVTSAGTVFESDSNLELLELVDSTIESKGGTAVKAKYNFKIKDAENSKIRGKKSALDTDANVELTMKKASEITSSDGIAIKTTSSLKIEADGGKIDGAAGAIVASSGANIVAQGLTISSSKEKAIAATSGLKIDLTDGSIVSAAESAIEGDSGMELTLTNSKLQGVASAITAKVSGLKLKATKKTRLVSATGYGILTASNADITLTDAAIEAGTKAFKGTMNSKLKLNQGARLAGKKGGLESDSNLELDGTGATIDGGSGPGIMAASNARIAFHQGGLKGVPAIQLERHPTSVDLDGTKVDGEQKIPK